MKAHDGVSPPRRVPDGIPRRGYENQREETWDTHQASVKNHRAILFVLVNVFSGLLPSRTFIFLYRVPAVGFSLSLFGHKPPRFRRLPSPPALI